MIQRIPFFFVMFVLIAAVFSVVGMRDSDLVVQDDDFIRLEYKYLGKDPTSSYSSLYQQIYTFKNYKDDYSYVGTVYSYSSGNPVDGGDYSVYRLDDIGSSGTFYFAGNIVVDPSITGLSHRDGRSFDSYFCRVTSGVTGLSFYDSTLQGYRQGLANPDQLTVTYKYTDTLYLAGYFINSDCFTEYGLAPVVTASDIDIAVYNTVTGNIYPLSNVTGSLSTDRVKEFMRANYFDPHRFVSVLQFGLVYRYYNYPITAFVNLFTPGSDFLDDLEEGFSLLDVLDEIVDLAPEPPGKPGTWNAVLDWLAYIANLIVWVFQAAFMLSYSAVKSLIILVKAIFTILNIAI